MTWITLAVVSTFLASASSILQKEILQSHLRHPFTLYLIGGMSQVVVSAVILLVVPGIGGMPLWVLGAGLALGLWNALLSVAMLKGIHMEEVSRAVPIIDSYPLFVALLAVFFLGEQLTPLKWAAVTAIMAGAFLASWHSALPGQRVTLSRAFYLLAAASMGIAVYNVVAKHLLGFASLWHLYALTFIGGAPLFLGVGLALGGWRETRQIFKERGKRFYLIAVLPVMGFISFIIWFYATNLGPVSLVSAVTSTRPVMVLAYVVLAKLLVDLLRHRPLLLGAYRIQAVAVGLVTLGVTALGLR